MSSLQRARSTRYNLNEHGEICRTQIGSIKCCQVSAGVLAVTAYSLTDLVLFFGSAGLPCSRDRDRIWPTCMPRSACTAGIARASLNHSLKQQRWPAVAAHDGSVTLPRHCSACAGARSRSCGRGARAIVRRQAAHVHACMSPTGLNSRLQPRGPSACPDHISW